MTQSTLSVQQGALKELQYLKPIGRSPAISDVFNSISDDKALTIFNTVALSSGKSDILLNTINLTRKQFYSKMERLTKQGLLVRRNGRYYLTTFGKVLYELQNILGLALNNYWKLKAIDSLQSPPGLPKFELNKVIDSLLENSVLKNMVLAKLRT